MVLVYCNPHFSNSEAHTQPQAAREDVKHCLRSTSLNLSPRHTNITPRHSASRALCQWLALQNLLAPPPRARAPHRSRGIRKCCPHLQRPVPAAASGADCDDNHEETGHRAGSDAPNRCSIMRIISLSTSTVLFRVTVRGPLSAWEHGPVRRSS